MFSAECEALTIVVNILVRNKARDTSVVGDASISESTSNDAKVDVGVDTGESLVYLAEKQPKRTDRGVT